MVIQACISPVWDIASGKSWPMLKSFDFLDLKISVKSLKYLGKVREFWHLPPVATLCKKSIISETHLIPPCWVQWNPMYVAIMTVPTGIQPGLPLSPIMAWPSPMLLSPELLSSDIRWDSSFAIKLLQWDLRQLTLKLHVVVNFWSGSKLSVRVFSNTSMYFSKIWF